jgi:hypothetical protein
VYKTKVSSGQRSEGEGIVNEATEAVMDEPQGRLIVRSSPPVSVHTGPFEFRMVSRKLAGRLEDHGGTLEVYGDVDGQAQVLFRFDCFAQGPHWHRCSPGKPDVIIQLEHQDAAQAVQFAVETLRTRFSPLLAEQGFAALSPLTDSPEVAAALSAMEGAMAQLIRRDPATL